MLYQWILIIYRAMTSMFVWYIHNVNMWRPSVLGSCIPLIILSLQYSSDCGPVLWSADIQNESPIGVKLGFLSVTVPREW